MVRLFSDGIKRTCNFVLKVIELVVRLVFHSGRYELASISVRAFAGQQLHELLLLLLGFCVCLIRAHFKLDLTHGKVLRALGHYCSEPEEEFDCLDAGVKLDRGVQIHLNATALVNDPSTEVPRQVHHALGVLARDQFLRVAPQVLEDRVRVRTIYVTFVHQWKSHSVFFGGNLQNAVVAVGFLSVELPTRKANNFKALVMVLTVQVLQRCILPFGERSV